MEGLFLGKSYLQKICQQPLEVLACVSRHMASIADDIADDVRESRRLVRMYSGDVEGRLPQGSKSHVLGQVLSRGQQDPRDMIDPWRKFLHPPELSETERFVQSQGEKSQ